MLKQILTSSKSVPQTLMYRLESDIDVTKELCLEAVKQNGWALQYVPGNLRTEQLCLIAVKQNGFALQDVPKQLRTEQVCLEAVKQDGDALCFVPEHLRTEHICLEAVKQNKEVLQIVPKDMLIRGLEKLIETSNHANISSIPRFSKVSKVPGQSKARKAKSRVPNPA